MSPADIPGERGRLLAGGTDALWRSQDAVFAMSIDLLDSMTACNYVCMQLCLHTRRLSRLFIRRSLIARPSALHYTDCSGLLNDAGLRGTLSRLIELRYVETRQNIDAKPNEAVRYR